MNARKRIAVAALAASLVGSATAAAGLERPRPSDVPDAQTTLAPNEPVAAIARALTVPEPSDTSTVGGCADTDANAVTVMPHGRSVWRQVTRTTPLARSVIAAAYSEAATSELVAAAD